MATCAPVFVRALCVRSHSCVPLPCSHRACLRRPAAQPPGDGPDRTILAAEWYNRLLTFSVPGPIDNTPLLCPHGQVGPPPPPSLPKGPGPSRQGHEEYALGRLAEHAPFPHSRSQFKSRAIDVELFVRLWHDLICAVPRGRPPRGFLHRCPPRSLAPPAQSLRWRAVPHARPPVSDVPGPRERGSDGGEVREGSIDANAEDIPANRAHACGSER